MESAQEFHSEQEGFCLPLRSQGVHLEILAVGMVAQAWNISTEKGQKFQVILS